MITEVPRSELDEALAECEQSTQLNRLDEAIIAAFPGWGVRRIAARQQAGMRRAMLAIGRAYNSVWPSTDRHSTYLPLTSEDALLPGFDRYQIMQEARALYRNSPLIRSIVDGIVSRVGSPKPHFHTDNEEWNKEARDQYHEWSIERADYTGNFTLDEMDEQIVRAQFTDGDIGEIYLDVHRDLQLQLIESDRIAPWQRTNINLDTMNPMAGVIKDRENRVQGYLVGDRGLGGTLDNTVFHSAAEMALYMRRWRVDQVRNVPLLHPVINPAKDLERYLNAVRVSMNVAASYGVFIERQNAAQFQLAESQAEPSTTAYRTKPLKNGLMTWLNTGEKVTQLDPKMPGPDFDPVSRFMVRLIARGAGSIYELAMADFSGMSYSASKTVLMFVWQMQDMWQDWLVRSRKRRVYNVWVAKRMDNGLLPFNPQAYDQVSWIRGAHAGFDPLEDAEAIVKLLGAGALNYRRYFASLGLNEETELAQSAREVDMIYKLAQKYNVPPEVIASTLAPGVMTSGNPQQPDPTGPGTNPRGKAGLSERTEKPEPQLAQPPAQPLAINLTLPGQPSRRLNVQRDAQGRIAAVTEE